MMPILKQRLAAIIGGLAGREEGASYTISFLIALPLYTLLIAAIIEATLLLVVRNHVTYAAYAAARQASIVLATDDLSAESQLGWIHLAAINAMWPVASGREAHASESGGTFKFNHQIAPEWLRAYRKYGGGSADEQWLARKVDYAMRATRIRVERFSSGLDAEVAVTVEYEMPFHASAAGRWFGEPARFADGAFFTRRITATARFPLETPRNSDQSLGINYFRRPGFTSNPSQLVVHDEVEP
jgi:hypothetical protein